MLWDLQGIALESYYLFVKKRAVQLVYGVDVGFGAHVGRGVLVGVGGT